MLTLHVADVVLPVVAPPVYAGAVLVRGDRVAAIGSAAELAAQHPDARVRRWRGVLSPGLVNAHAHLQYTDYADLATPGGSFPEWIGRLTARRGETTDREWQEATRRGVHELLSTGTTAVADVVTDAVALVPPARTGLAGVSYLEVVAVDDGRWPAARAALETALAAAPAGRTVGVSPHTVYTLGTRVLEEVVALARAAGLRLHTHLAETAAEAEYVLAGTGPLAEAMTRFGLAFELLHTPGGTTAAAHLAAQGGLGDDVHVAHGVHLTAEDRRLLRESGTTVALCPRSNATLGAGEPPVAAYLHEGSPIAVGTDSRASSPSLDLLAEVSELSRLARAQGYREADLDRRLVEAATVGGAAAIGLDDIGRLAPGVRADLAVFDVPLAGDPWSALVHHGPGRCSATVLGGRLVHRAAAAAGGGVPADVGRGTVTP